MNNTEKAQVREVLLRLLKLHDNQAELHDNQAQRIDGMEARLKVLEQATEPHLPRELDSDWPPAGYVEKLRISKGK